MSEFIRAIGQLGFSLFYALIMLLTFVFVLPIVRLREWFALRKSKAAAEGQRQRLYVGLIVLVAASMLLAGCTVDNSIVQSREVLDRSVDFAKSAPPAPYDPIGDESEYSHVASDNDLLLTGSELAHVLGAAAITAGDPALVAAVIEQELRWLDDGELERDVLSALAGENSSIGLGQVRLSTAEELEIEDRAGLFPEYVDSDSARTERIRRLANSDWNILYVSAYLQLLAQRFPSDGPLDLAQRYIGTTPQSPRLADQAELLDLFSQMY